MSIRALMQQAVPGSRQWLAGMSVLILFGVLFALPLYAALTVCTTSCCQESDTCAKECGIRSDEGAPETIATLAQERHDVRSARLVVAVAAALTDRPAATAHGNGEVRRRADAPLHVLNSVFRI